MEIGKWKCKDRPLLLGTNTLSCDSFITVTEIQVLYSVCTVDILLYAIRQKRYCFVKQKIGETFSLTVLPYYRALEAGARRESRPRQETEASHRGQAMYPSKGICSCGQSFSRFEHASTVKYSTLFTAGICTTIVPVKQHTPKGVRSSTP